VNGPAPMGAIGPMSGDANGDASVDPADIFYAVNYLFRAGPRPESQPGRPASSSFGAPINGAITLGKAQFRNGHYVIPVLVTLANGSATPQAMSLSIRLDENSGDAVIRRAGVASSLQPLFEISRRSSTAMSYLISFDESTPLAISNGSAVIAEIELTPRAAGRIDIDPALTLLTNAEGTRSATVGNGMLRLHGTTLGDPSPRTPKQNAKGTNAE